jgi:hypothetical protein
MHDATSNRNDPHAEDVSPDNESGSLNQDYWLQIARDAFTESSSYFDSNIRSGIERNLAHFQNKHAPGSKYFKATFKHRHKGFRPKTRSMLRKKEAALARALFSTADVVHVAAERGKDKSHKVSADINQELLQYRLTNTIPWFLTAMGAYQDASVAGVCISHQFWDYQEQSNSTPMVNGESGEPEMDDDGQPVMNNAFKILKDTPAVELRPIENVLFSPSADWRDPVQTSPFLIDKIAMTVDEVKKMAEPSRTSKIPWFDLTDAQLLTGVTTDYDAVRQAREGNREDSKDQRYTTSGFQTVWVHRNIIRKDGRDWIYYTLGIHARLSDPVPLEEEYPHLQPGERPYVIGINNIETHKVYPESLTGMSSGSQQEANEINNQRRDNVNLAMNRRYFVRRSAMIDYGSLQRNVPGGVTEMDDIKNDIRVEAPPDVTASSYEEQDRINNDFDELTGHFSSGSVNSNRKLNETVGGMDALTRDADELTEYPMLVFVKTWVEPVLKQLLRLEQRHETNKALLELMGEKLELYQQYGISDVTDAWIQGTMNLSVNVGFGATNPKQRIDKLSLGLGTVMNFVPSIAARLDGEEVLNEIFGALGYANAERFFPPVDPEAKPQEPQAEPLSDLDRAKLDQEYQMHQDKIEDGNMTRQHATEMAFMKREETLYKMAEEKTITMEQLKLEREKLTTDRQNKVDEFNVKLRTGSGI